MKITDKTSTETRFGDLKPGDTFKIYGDIYIKTDNKEAVCVDLRNGECGHLHDSEIVIPVTVEAIVTSKTEL